MIIESDVKLDYADVLIAPKWSALGSRDVGIAATLRTFMFRHTVDQLLTTTTTPIIASNMDHTGTLGMAEATQLMGCNTALNKFYEVPPAILTAKSKAELGALLDKSARIRDVWEEAWHTIGCSDESLKKLEFLLKIIPNLKLCIDVANGHTENFRLYIQQVRAMAPRAVIMAGNVASASMTQALILAGADIVKVGIGSGSVCLTRKMTGVGYPQLSAIIECADTAHGLGGHICADGGIVVPGDICKAFAAGADFVMLGSMFAGHDECAGERIVEYTEGYDGNGSPTVDERITGITFRGMASREAQMDHYGEVKEYRAIEGKQVVVPYKGTVRETIKEIYGGIRSCMTYIGAKNLKSIPKCATLIRVNRQLNESLS